MKENEKIFLWKLKEGPFIEMFRLEDMNDTIFDNYQRYDFYQLIWFTKAGGDPGYLLDFNEYALADNQIVLVFPGQIDMMCPEGKKGFLFAIHNDIFFEINRRINSGYLNGYFSNVFIEPDDTARIILQEITKLMLQEYNGRNRLTLMQSYMEAFLFHLSSFFEDSEKFQNKNDAVVAELMKLIDHNFVEERETDFYAGKMGMTNKTINEACKMGTGKTVKQHLQEKLILEIKKEIRLTSNSLKEIAFDLGFSEPAYFTRFFKLHTGITPKQFRDS